MLSEGRLGVDNVYSLREGIAQSLQFRAITDLFNRSPNIAPGQGELRTSRFGWTAGRGEREERNEASMGHVPLHKVMSSVY